MGTFKQRPIRTISNQESKRLLFEANVPQRNVTARRR